MREILFRGKRKDNGEQIEGSLIRDVFYRHGTEECCYILNVDNLKYYDSFYDLVEDYGIYEVIPETVGQYTGLTDKNGRKIFEGDIIKIRLDYIEDDETISKVYDFNGVLCVDYETPDYNSTALGFLYGEGVYEFEVIGNIHDNPELLNK